MLSDENDDDYVNIVNGEDSGALIMGTVKNLEPREDNDENDGFRERGINRHVAVQSVGL